jgi:hypothetical protein
MMTVNTDRYPRETRWELVDDCQRNGKVVLQGGPYASRFTQYIAESQFGESQYTLNVYDEFGDGLCCGYGQGSYSATMDSVVVGSGGRFTNLASSTFGSCQPGYFVMTVTTDNYPSETRWELVDDCDNGKIVMQGGPYTSAGTKYIENSQVGKSQFTLNVYDEFGDGLCCAYGQGSFSATMDGVVVDSGGDFDKLVSSTFGSCTNPSASVINI